MKLSARSVAYGVGLLLLIAGRAHAQSFGVELHNTMMPASGGMGGTSIARPQDMISALNGNPAAMSQFDGTHFTFGGGWADPNFHLRQEASLPVARVTPFDATSGTPGAAVGNIGLTQNFEDWGKPITMGVGLISNAGGGVDFRKFDQSNGTSSQLLVLQFTGGMSVQLSDRWAVGATLSVGQAFFDTPFAGLGAMTPAYGIRGAVGLSYQLSMGTTLGFYYQSKEDFCFQDAIRLSLPGNLLSRSFDVQMGLPDNLGFGISNSSLMDGRLLLAADVLYKQWDNCDLFRSIYKNQWVVQTGAQYRCGSCRYRLGYVWSENPISPITSVNVDGLPIQDLVPGAQYLQSQLAIVNQHRLSAGFGLVDVLPGVNFDTFAGCMFHASQDLGATHVGVSSYFLGAGITWRFGACSGMRTRTCHN